jgi:hypothetical protein
LRHCLQRLELPHVRRGYAGLQRRAQLALHQCELRQLRDVHQLRAGRKRLPLEHRVDRRGKLQLTFVYFPATPSHPRVA